MTDHRHDIGDCGSHGDFETCSLEMSTPATVPGCMVRFNLGPKINLIEKNTNLSILLAHK
jgi:hypothetical protein